MPSSSRGSRLLRFFYARLIPGLLLVAVFWSLVQVVGVFIDRSMGQQLYNDRQPLYSATATALAGDTVEGDDTIRLAQFVTNTPQPDAGGDAVTPETVATATPETSQIPVGTPIDLPELFRPPETDITEIAGTAVPTQVPLIPREYELVNILLLGGDEDVDQSDNTVRTDTMIVVSVNTETRTVAMLSLPRDLFVYVPTPTMQRLNTVYGIGEAFNWEPDGGFGLLRQTIFHNFGINVHYYARVNFSGFAQLVDLLGGVDVLVDCAYSDYPLIGAEVPSEAIQGESNLYTLPVGVYRMSGAEVLWYVRTRNVTIEFDRGRRQQQVLRGMLRAGRDNGQLSQLPQLWNELTGIVETDIPFDVMLGLLPIALQIDSGRIENFTLERGYHTTPWQPPSGALAGQFVQLPNYEPIRDLLEDFYLPPTSSQLQLSGATIAVYNASGQANWDLVASEILRERGFNAYAAGQIDETLANTVLIDQTGSDKSSPVPVIADLMQINAQNVFVQPDAARDADYVIRIGSNYDSCPAVIAPVDS